MSARALCVGLAAFGVCVTSWSGSSAAAGAAQAGQKSAFVTVIADGASPLRELKAADFVVHEDKATHKVLEADLATDALYVSLLVDTSMPPQGVLPPTQELRSSLSTFVGTLQAANPESQIALTEIAGAAVPKVPFTASAADLDKAIQRLVPNEQSGAVVLEALSDASKQLATKPAPRRAIVSIDFNSPEGSADQTIKRVADDVHKCGATVWAISIRGAGVSPSSRDAVLNAVTQGTGGLRLSGAEPTALAPLLKRVAASLLSQYTVTFARDGNVNVKALRMETTGGARVLLTPFMR
jgi:hypothetical protein